MEFCIIWALLVENGASARKEEGTRRYWDTLSAQQQKAAISTISGKLKDGRFVHFDPIQAIKENIRTCKVEEPTNYNHRKLPSEPVFSARYNGQWGMYTLEDIRKYKLETASA